MNLRAFGSGGAVVFACCSLYGCAPHALGLPPGPSPEYERPMVPVPDGGARQPPQSARDGGSAQKQTQFDHARFVVGVR